MRFCLTLLCLCFGVNAFSQINANCQVAGVWMPYFPKCNSNNYVLAFVENFDGDSIDKTKWQIQPWRQGAIDGDGWQDHYSFRNVELKDGICRIVSKKETVVRRAIEWMADTIIVGDGKQNLRTYHYTSANMWTLESFYYGIYEARCRLPKGKGFWPAFWTYGGGAGNGWNEIDVFDNYSGINDFVTSVGYDFDEEHKSNGCSKIFYNQADFSQWHTFTCVFEPDKIVWKVDNETIRTLYRFTTATDQPIQCGEEVAAGTYFQKKSFPMNSMCIILSSGVGSEHGPSGPPDETTPFPSSMDIDYVRYYKRNDLPTSYINVYPNPTNGLITVSVDDIEIDLRLQLFDNIGKMVNEELIRKKMVELDYSDYSKGLYFVNILDRVGHIVHQSKILIE